MISPLTLCPGDAEERRGRGTGAAARRVAARVAAGRAGRRLQLRALIGSGNLSLSPPWSPPWALGPSSSAPV